MTKPWDDDARDPSVRPEDAAADNAAKVTAAQVRVLCADGTIHHALIGYGNTCEQAYADAEVKANAFCSTHGGTQKSTRVKCPAM